MRKAITIFLALVMVLSLTACGGGKAITKDDLETALKNTDKELSLQQSDNSNNEFNYSGKSTTNTSDYYVKTNDKGELQYLKISFQNIDTSLLSSADSISNVTDLLMNHPGDSKLKDARAGVCISQMINLITLFDASYSKKSSAELIVAVANAFSSNGSSQFGSWNLSSTMNETEKTVEIIAEPAK